MTEKPDSAAATKIRLLQPLSMEFASARFSTDDFTWTSVFWHDVLEKAPSLPAAPLSGGLFSSLFSGSVPEFFSAQHDVFFAGLALQQHPVLPLLSQQEPLQQQVLLDLKKVETQKSLI